MPSDPTPKIFISYAWKNQPTAKRLQSDLKRDGVEVFVDYERIAGGDSLPARISAGLDWCNTLILLWSTEAAQSRYVSEEWESAFHLEKKIIPCVLDSTALPALLRKRLYLNFAPYENGYAQLCRSLGVAPKPRPEKTAPPETLKSKLPPQHAEMPAPQPPEEKRETPPPVTPKRKSIVETFRRKPKRPDPAPVLKPPEIFNDAKHDDAAKEGMPSRWSRRKTLVALILVAAIVLTGMKVCQYVSEQSSKSAQTEPRFRNEPDTLSYQDVKAMLQRHDFYCRDYDWNKEFSNPKGQGFKNQFEKQQNGQVIFDRASGLMWQQSGSDEAMTFAAAEEYVRGLNAKKFAGYENWRLPTLEEAMSLMEPKAPDGDLYIDLLFDRKQSWIWTSDAHSAGVAWVAYFNDGSCYRSPVPHSTFVRVVR